MDRSKDGKFVTAAAVQMYCNRLREENIEAAEKAVREAASRGAQIVLLPELFETPYFCQERNYDFYRLAASPGENPAIGRLRKTAAELRVVLPVSFFERDENVTYNSVAVIDADGSVLGIYRKTHIPDDHFYQEKFYFTPGNTGFRVWDTVYGRIGIGICWDQWFPEAARCMALMGAQLLLYPTAIGSEPIIGCDSMPHWRRCMQGHAAANVIPVIVANRVGEERVTPGKDNNNQSSSLTFYGSSFITDETGEILEEAGRTEEKILLHTFDLEAAEELRFSWGLFRDRRPEMYGRITQ
ncbi:MAG: N-carbamoylputrescine amidase [Roseburia sp.]|nr:N-carbamoylputrescine amidase [Roseburia sp.]